MLSGWHRTPHPNARVLPAHLPYSIRQLCLNDDLAEWEYYAWSPRTLLDLVHALLNDHEVSQGEIGSGLQRVELRLDASSVQWEKRDEAEFETICKRYGVQSSLELAWVRDSP